MSKTAAKRAEILRLSASYASLCVADGHAITDRVERAVRAAFPVAEVLAHQEPAGIADDRLDQRLRK